MVVVVGGSKLWLLSSRLVVLRQIGRGNPAPLEQLTMYSDHPELGVNIFPFFDIRMSRGNSLEMSWFRLIEQV